MTAAPTEFRLAKLMATLSRATDIANGATFEQSLASSVVAARLAESMGLGEEEARDAYYLTMLRTVGCTGDGDLARLLLGDDVGVWLTHLPNGSPVAMMAALVTQVGRDKKPGARASAVARAFANLPRIMANLDEVQVLDSRRSRWIARGPGGVGVEWEAEIINEVPNELIAWRSTSGTVDHAGSVHFEPGPGGRGTIVRVSLQYDPPGGTAGHAIAALLGSDAGSRIEEDLQNFKRMMESGEAVA